MSVIDRFGHSSILIRLRQGCSLIIHISLYLCCPLLIVNISVTTTELNIRAKKQFTRDTAIVDVSIMKRFPYIVSVLKMLTATKQTIRKSCGNKRVVFYRISILVYSWFILHSDIWTCLTTVWVSSITVFYICIRCHLTSLSYRAWWELVLP